jgi:DNA-binding GntR family transcriptional regulator
MIVFNSYAKDLGLGQMARKKPLLLSAQIYERLESDIGARVYPPGSHLAEDEIAAELGVSRTPVREAFRMLEREGWLEIVPHGGAYVRNPPMDEMHQVFEVRQCLEERAANLAAKHATESDLAKLRRIIEEGKRQVELGDVERITALNAEFHCGIAEVGKNHILAKMLVDLSKQVHWHFSAVATIRCEDSWREHEEIVRAISLKDADTASRLAVEHNRRTQEAFFLRLVHGDNIEVSGPAI